MTTLMIAVMTFVPMLVLLVIWHEFGHYLTARMFRMKVLEFGIGFPPRLFGIYRGRTTVLVDDDTVFNTAGSHNLTVLSYGPEFTEERRHLVEHGYHPKVVVWSSETDDGRLVARKVAVLPDKHSKFLVQQTQPEDEAGLLRHEGVLRSMDENSIVLADMVYSINWIPLGGFVRLVGEDDRTTPKSFGKSPAWQQFIVLVAGCAMNLLLAVLLLTAVPFLMPRDGGGEGWTRVIEVVADSPASAAGLQAGDRILLPEEGGFPAFQETIRSSAGREINFQVVRDGVENVLTVPVTPGLDPEGSGRGWVGIMHTGPQSRPSSVGSALSSSVSLMVGATVETAKAIKDGGVQSLDVVGPVGLARLTGQASASLGTIGWFLMAAIFSFNLAIFNMLPIPALDGGRVMLLGLEVIRGGRPLPLRAVQIIQGVSITALIALAVLITAFDILDIFTGAGPTLAP